MTSLSKYFLAVQLTILVIVGDKTLRRKKRGECLVGGERIVFAMGGCVLGSAPN